MEHVLAEPVALTGDAETYLHVAYVISGGHLDGADPDPGGRRRAVRSTGFDQGWGPFSVEAVPGLPHDGIGLSLLATGAGPVRVDRFGIAPAGPVPG